MKAVITGAAGAIGSVLADGFARQGLGLRLLDIRTPGHVPAGAVFRTVDLRDIDAVVEATPKTDVVLHLGGLSSEGTFAQVCEHNMLTTYNVLEAARRNSVRRVVLASSHHAVGFHEVGERLGPASPAAPDTFYAVSKLTGEALGSLYADKFGLEVVAVRIGSFREHPHEARHAATWLSHTDGTRLFHAAMTARLRRRYLMVYGVSDNSLCWWPRDGWEELGHHPRDCAGLGALPPLRDRWQGGSYPETLPPHV